MLRNVGTLPPDTTVSHIRGQQNFTVATVRHLNSKRCNTRCLHFHQKSAKRYIRRSILLSTATLPGKADIAICTQEQYLTPQS